MKWFAVLLYVLIGLGVASAEYRYTNSTARATLAWVLWPVAVGVGLWNWSADQPQASDE